MRNFAAADRVDIPGPAAYDIPMLWFAVLLAATAQGGREERGRFKLAYFGKDAGVEEYRIEEFEDGHVVVFSNAKFEVEIRGQKRPYLVDTALTLAKDWTPMLYAGYHKVGSEERIRRVEWKKGVAVVDRKKEVKTSSRFVVDNNVAAHLVPILRRYGGGRRTVKAFNPFSSGEMDVSIEDLGKVTLYGSGRTVEAVEYRLSMGALGTVTAHLDPASRLIRAWNPMLSWLAELEGFEGLAREPLDGLPEGVEEREVEFHSGAVVLAGALTRPRKGGTYPAVVLISDAGPHDRDGNPLGGEGVRAWSGFRHAAYALSEAGVIVLRYDDRGCGKSGGDFAAAGLSVLASDARAAADFLRGRKDVSQVALAGHGEGGVAASMAAGADEGIRAVFLLASPARPWNEVLLERLERRLIEEGGREDSVAAALEAQRRLFDRIRLAEGDYLEIDERRTYIGALKESFNSDPAAEARKVKGAVVVMHGLKDNEVGADHAEKLREARPDAEVITFEGLDHWFMPSPGGPGLRGDQARRPDAAFLKALVKSVSGRLR